MTSPTNLGRLTGIAVAAMIAALDLGSTILAPAPAEAAVFVGFGFGFPIGFPGYYYSPYPYYPPPHLPYYPPPAYHPAPRLRISRPPGIRPRPATRLRGWPRHHQSPTRRAAAGPMRKVNSAGNTNRTRVLAIARRRGTAPPVETRAASGVSSTDGWIRTGRRHRRLSRRRGRALGNRRKG